MIFCNVVSTIFLASKEMFRLNSDPHDWFLNWILSFRFVTKSTKNIYSSRNNHTRCNIRLHTGSLINPNYLYL